MGYHLKKEGSTVALLKKKELESLFPDEASISTIDPPTANNASHQESAVNQGPRFTQPPWAGKTFMITNMFVSQRSIRLLRCSSARRGLATAALSRFEPDTRVDFSRFTTKINTLRPRLKRPLTYAEKVLYSHLDDQFDQDIVRSQTQLRLRPVRIACQDATAQMAPIQFMSAGLDTAAVPTTVHCDHLIVSRNGEEPDLARALDTHKEVYDFMESACQKYGMGFWRPGAGIIHQVVLENYAYPAGIMVGTNSHTPNAGGMGMIAVGVGGADAVDVMAGFPFELTAPRMLGVRLHGALSGWTSPKDIINKVAGMISVKGGTGSIIEYFGPGTQTLSATGMATVCNMGAETGATTSIFPYVPSMTKYLRANRRPDIASAIDEIAHELQADAGTEYDEVIDIDLSTLEPHVNGPFTPDLSTPLSKFKQTAENNKWPSLTAGLIGSCTNSSFHDLSRAASVARQALDAGIKPEMPLLLSPGSLQTRDTLEKAGILQVLERAGATMLPNACGPCCGSWDRTGMPKGTKNSIITSYNRNFSGRLDSNPGTHTFLVSPEVVMAKVFAPDLGFNPTTDSLTTPSGERFRQILRPASKGDRSQLEVEINPNSQRQQKLAPFNAWSGNDFKNCLILIKAKGKCTTDHITPAGPWFRFRGHQENISNNTLIGAINAETGGVNKIRNQISKSDCEVPATARHYQLNGRQWVVIADHNYGEGSSREHAALQPRYLGGVAIIAKSFARIHEANLKKQGILAGTFMDEADYDRIRASDLISITGLAEFAPGSSLTLEVTPTDGNRWKEELGGTIEAYLYQGADRVLQGWECSQSDGPGWMML
ncbi:hypothetical protein BDW62DRAFT_204552 [Aspergillus aurantiobrunneus]